MEPYTKTKKDMKPVNTKNLMLITTLALVILFTSCGSELERKQEELKAKRDELSAIKKEIKTIEEEIVKLDTSKVAEDLPKVFVKPVKKQLFQSFVEVHGVVNSDKNVTVMPEASGVIRSIRVRDGQQVRKGQTLATIDTDIINKNIAEIKKSLEFAADVYEKQKKLYDQKVGTELQFLEAKNRKESLEKTLSTLQTQASKGVISSPIDGKIEEIFPNTGEMASPQSPFARIVNTNDVYLDLDVSESLLNKVKIGDVVQARFPYQKDTMMVKIDYKGNYINPNNRTFKVHCNVKKSHKAMPPNLLAVVKLRDDHIEDAIVVPTNIIQNDGKADFVFVIKDGKSVKKTVTTGPTYQVLTTITSGLEVGDQLVVEGHKGLTKNSKVKVLKK